MASFTMQLKKVIEFTGGTANVDPETGIRKLVGGDIGLQYYPIFEEEYRDRLTGLIVDHFWNREIGRETIDDFQRAMRHRMNVIMPQYNLLYKSTTLTYDPLRTMDMTAVATGSVQSEREANSAGTSASTTNGISNSRNVNSEFPQTNLAGDEDYATNSLDSNGSTSSGANSTNSATDTGTESQEQESETRTFGYQGSPADLVLRYRESIINVDSMILLDLDDLFMQILSSNEEYYPHGWMY